jgi:D-inositol-3-phosphate glycosyltransferase
LRILFVCDYYPPHIGGAELVYSRYCEGMVKRGHSVRVITIKHSKDLACDELLNGVQIHRIDTPLRSRHLFAFWSLFSVIKYAKEADIIHCAFFVSPFSAIPASKIKGKPLVVTIHEVWGRNWFKFERNPIRAIIDYLGEKILIRMPYNAITCPSIFTLKTLREFGVKEAKIKYIPNGIEFEHFKPRSKDPDLLKELGLKGYYVYMFYGRPGISKGVEYLVRAAKLIKMKMKKSKLLMILGKEPKRKYEKILYMIDEFKLKDHICLLDPLSYDDLPKYISLADLVVVPSLSEGFGYSAAESAAMGKPIVASNAGSLPEIVTHKESGILVRPRSPEEIFTAVCELFDDEKCLVKMGKAARAKVSKFNWEKSLDSLETLYMDVLKRA